MSAGRRALSNPPSMPNQSVRPFVYVWPPPGKIALVERFVRRQFVPVRFGCVSVERRSQELHSEGFFGSQHRFDGLEIHPAVVESLSDLTTNFLVTGEGIELVAQGVDEQLRAGRVESSAIRTSTHRGPSSTPT